MVLTDGRWGGGIDENKEVIIATRLNELKQAMEFAGIKNYRNLMIKDREVKANLRKINTLNLHQYDFVFVPNGDEFHIDHRPILNYVKKILKNSRKTRIVAYEVWSPIPNPNLYLDISAIVEKKRALISLYKSQIKHNDYANKAISLNHYRGLTRCEYAEAFSLKSKKSLWQKLGFSFTRLENRLIIRIFGIKISIKTK